MDKLIDARLKNMENFSIYKNKMEEPGRLYTEAVTKAYKAGAISSKHKRLMALVGALFHGCEPCMFA